jgi:hypothetical protein
MEKLVDVRGHHLITLSNLHMVQRFMHVNALKEARVRRLAVQNYKDPELFNAHLMSVIEGVLSGQTQKVRIVADYDTICAGCYQKRGDACEVWKGYQWSSDFLEMADREIIEASNGVLVEGGVYPSAHLTDNIQAIRLAIIKAAIQIPQLLRFA